MPGKIIRVRDADGREFDAMPADARRHGWEVIDEPQPEPQALTSAGALSDPVAVVDQAIADGSLDGTPPSGDPTQTPADAADEPSTNPVRRKKNNQAAVIEPAPTSEGTDR